MGKEQNAYFHVSIACIRKGNGKGNADFDGHQIEVNDIIKERLAEDHIDYLFEQLGFSL